MESIIKTMLNFRNQIKLYHWKTDSYSRHKATDNFLELFDEKTDRFIETMMGCRNIKIKDKFKLEFTNINDKNADDYVKTFRKWLAETLPKSLLENESDLLNIRDEILGDVNRMLFLFTLV